MRLWAGVPFLVIAALPFLLMHRMGDAALPTSTTPADETLIILSPHSLTVQDEYSRGFAAWMLAEQGRQVEVQWIDAGGTSKMLKELESRFATRADGPGVDLLFGGGVDPYINAKRLGWLEPVQLSEETLAAIPPRCAGFPTRDEEGHWFGVALAGFGILHNRALLERMNLPTPKTWEDLAHPELYSWVGSGDPSSSGSVHMCYEIILQAAGFEDGWRMIVRMCGNVRRFGEGGGTVPREVTAGDIACGMVIDTYAERTIDEVGSDALAFVLPLRMTLISPDSIAMLKQAPSPELAQHFIEFALSEAGQALLVQPPGVNGQSHALHRKPVHPALYDGPHAPRVNPHLLEAGFSYDSVKGGGRWQVVSDLIRVWCIDSHTSLRSAWRAVIDAGLPEELVKQLTEPPCSEEEAMRLAERWGDEAFRQTTKGAWADAAATRYAAVREAALSRGKR